MVSSFHCQYVIPLFTLAITFFSSCLMCPLQLLLMNGLIFADPDMQSEIDTHISEGQATFNVLMLVGDLCKFLFANGHELTCCFWFIPKFPFTKFFRIMLWNQLCGTLCLKMVFDRHQECDLVVNEVSWEPRGLRFKSQHRQKHLVISFHLF